VLLLLKIFKFPKKPPHSIQPFRQNTGLWHSGIVCHTSIVGRKASAFRHRHLRYSLIRFSLFSLLVSHSHDVLTACTTQATDSNRARELKMPPADQIQTLDPGQRAYKDRLDLADDFLAVTANTAVKCQRSLSCKVNHHQLSIVNCTQLMMLLPNGWRRFGL